MLTALFHSRAPVLFSQQLKAVHGVQVIIEVIEVNVTVQVQHFENQSYATEYRALNIPDSVCTPSLRLLRRISQKPALNNQSLQSAETTQRHKII